MEPKELCPHLLRLYAKSIDVKELETILSILLDNPFIKDAARKVLFKKLPDPDWVLCGKCNSSEHRSNLHCAKCREDQVGNNLINFIKERLEKE
jgi:hypothetical protein